MKRRNFLKAFLAAPFAGLLKKEKYYASGGGSSGPSISASSTASSSTSNRYLYEMRRLQIEAAHKAANPLMYIHYTDGHPSYRVNFIGTKRQK